MSYVKLSNRLMKMFRKDEILSVAKESNVKVKDSMPLLSIIDKILVSMEEEIPDPDTCSDITFEFMLNADIVDENGNVLELEEESEQEEISEDKEENETEELEKYPECFSFADEADPACKKCLVLDKCIVERVSNRPACYGKLYNAHAEECKLCIEAVTCSKVTKRNKR